MLDDDIKLQLAAYLERVKEPFEMVASLDDGESSQELRELLQEVVNARPDMITLRTDGADARKPSFTLARPGSVGTRLQRSAKGSH